MPAPALQPVITIKFANAEAHATVDIVKTYNTLEIKVDGKALYCLDLYHTAKEYDDSPDKKPYPQMIIYSSRDGFDAPVTHVRSFANGATKFVKD